MRFNEKRIQFIVKCYKTEKYIYEKKIEAIDYALFLNDLTNLYIKAGDYKEVNKLFKIQSVFIY
nr:MAG TPA: hypothetical protein [Caudoviricetes sp.]